MKRSTKVFLSTSLVFLAVSLGFNLLLVGVTVTSAQAGKIRLGFQRELDLLQLVFQGIRQNYVEPEVVKDKTVLIHGGVEGMLRALDDPYSRFMPPKDFSEMRTESAGEFGGLGIVIGMRDGRVTVISPIADTPAYKKGVEAGDIIVKVDGETIENLSLQQVVDQLRGKVGSKVLVTFFRPSLRKLLDIEIVRDTIPLPATRQAYLPDDVGYIHLPGFNQKSAPDLEAQLAEWDKKGMKGFILDLRSNPGGLLEAAVAVSKLFLGEGKIVSVKDRNGQENTFTSFRARFARWPLVVLINEGSASASEIVAGAIKDNGRGILLGQKSFGKGSVQTVIPLQDGSAMALTTAYYYTPSGVCIHKKGILPDILVDSKALTTDELIELRQLRGRLLAEPTLEKQEEKSPDEVYAELAELDTQLAAAMEVIRGALRLEALGKDAIATAADPKRSAPGQR